MGQERNASHTPHKHSVSPLLSLPCNDVVQQQKQQQHDVLVVGGKHGPLPKVCREITGDEGLQFPFQLRLDPDLSVCRGPAFGLAVSRGTGRTGMYIDWQIDQSSRRWSNARRYYICMYGAAGEGGTCLEGSHSWDHQRMEKSDSPALPRHLHLT